MSHQKPETSIDYDRLMRENLSRVFNERDAAVRLQAIQEIYTDDATLYEPQNTSARGHLAISQAVDALSRNLPPAFIFTPVGTAAAHHGVGRLHWQAGPPGSPVALTGTDVAHFVNGRIHSLYVFLDQPGA